jgi:kumamolisin
VSDVFPIPDYQKAHVSVPGGEHRGVPDVAGNASPLTGYLVVADGQAVTTGGTSAVSPLYAGLTARLAEGVGGKVGYLSPFFYEHPECFHDITKGSNGGYKAGPGWDAATGLGSPDGTKMLDALKTEKAKSAPAKA